MTKFMNFVTHSSEWAVSARRGGGTGRHKGLKTPFVLNASGRLPVIIETRIFGSFEKAMTCEGAAGFEIQRRTKNQRVGG